MGSQALTAEAEAVPATPDACPLGEAQQTRNVLLFGVITALNYLATPVTYVWVHATLCDRLVPSATVANLPATAFLVMAMTPVLVVWYFPSAALFRPLLVVSNVLFTAMSAVVVAALLLPLPDGLKVTVVVLHGAVAGGTLTLASTLMFEVLGRGVAGSRRARALTLGYGYGPLLAVIACIATQLVLPSATKGQAGGVLEFPWNFAVLFAASVPIMAGCAFLSALFVIPFGDEETTRLPFRQGVFGGLGNFLGRPLLRQATIVAVLAFAGFHILGNMMLYTREAMDAAPEEWLGYQQTLRYSFKIVTGLFLGWLLTRTHAKAVLLVNLVLGILAVLWALLAAGLEYLVAFALFGGGELFGIYITNYILSASPPAQMRRHMAYTSLTAVVAAAAGPLFGGIRDYFGNVSSPAVAFQVSFAVSAAFLAAALGVTLFLPPRPRPE